MVGKSISDNSKNTCSNLTHTSNDTHIKYRYSSLMRFKDNNNTQENILETKDDTSVLKATYSSLEPNKWTRVYVTTKLQSVCVNISLWHILCPITNESSPDTLKIYYRNSQLEEGRYPSIYSQNDKETGIIRDNSGMGNDGTSVYNRVELPVIKLETKNPQLIPFDYSSDNNGTWTFTQFTGNDNQRLRFARLKKDYRYFYTNSTLCYEMDIKFENVIMTDGKTLSDSSSDNYVISKIQSQTYDSNEEAIDWSGINFPANRADNTFAKMLGDGKTSNETYKIRVDIPFGTTVNVSSDVVTYDIELRLNYVKSGKITISNLHVYYQNEDTSKLAIADHSSVGSNSVWFNGKNRINCGTAIPKEMDEATISCWLYQKDWANATFVYDTVNSTPRQCSIMGTNVSIDSKTTCGFGLKAEKKENHINLCSYHTSGDWSSGCLVDYSNLSSGWHLFTGVATKNKKQIYIDGKLEKEVIHNIGYPIKNYLGSYECSFNIGGEPNYTDLITNLVDVHLADPRLYPIALSASDIKALYNVKAKIDNTGTIYCNQAIETKPENIMPLLNDERYLNSSCTISFGSTGTRSYKDGILKYIFTSVTSNSNQGFYISNKCYGGELITNKRYRYSFWVRVSRSSTYFLGEEKLESLSKKLEAGRWYYIENEGIANSVNKNFIFYNKAKDAQIDAQIGDVIEVRDIQLYRLCDYNNEFYDYKKYDSHINNKGQYKSFELDETGIDRLISSYVYKHDAWWVPIFYHNTNGNTVWFENEDEAKHCIDNEYKYSILDQVESFRQSDGKFEFLLEYPLDFPEDYNRWKQTDNPNTLSTGTNDVVTSTNGYEAIHIDWTSNEDKYKFGGLLANNNAVTSTYIDGNSNSIYGWYFAIGCYNNSSTRTDTWKDKMPGISPDGKYSISTTNKGVQEVILYARINDDFDKHNGAGIIDKYGAEWLEIFYHDTNNNTEWFEDSNEVLRTNSKYKYSILSEIEKFRNLSTKKFEFLLEYPDDFPGEYNRWLQLNNPVEVYENVEDTSTTVNGYEAIHIDWSGCSDGTRLFGGLLRSTNKCTFIDGNVNADTWFYSIGCYLNEDQGSWNKRLPGPTKGEIADSVSKVKLYVRIDNLTNRDDIFKIYNRETRTKEIIEI